MLGDRSLQTSLAEAERKQRCEFERLERQGFRPTRHTEKSAEYDGGGKIILAVVFQIASILLVILFYCLRFQELRLLSCVFWRFQYYC